MASDIDRPPQPRTPVRLADTSSPSGRLSRGRTAIEKCRRNAAAAVNVCARATKERVAIDWPHNTSANEMLHRLRGDRDRFERAAAFECLAYMFWPESELVGADLSRADLKSANLDSACSALPSSSLLRAVIAFRVKFKRERSQWCDPKRGAPRSGEHRRG
jgi:hypothetical protein